MFSRTPLAFHSSVNCCRISMLLRRIFPKGCLWRNPVIGIAFGFVEFPDAHDSKFGVFNFLNAFVSDFGREYGRIARRSGVIPRPLPIRHHPIDRSAPS